MNDTNKIILNLLEKRFFALYDKSYHPLWQEINLLLTKDEKVLNIVSLMEETGGEPSVIIFPNAKYAVIDLVKESPKPRRSFCYDDDALNKRKDFKPSDSAAHFAATIGARLLSEEEYIYLQNIIVIDEKSSTWLLTPSLNRDLGGALYGERKFGKIIIGANGADSYFSSRGVRLIVPLGDY